MEAGLSQEKERLLARKARIDSRLAAIAETEAKTREKEDQRRADLAGRAVLKRAKKNKTFAAQLHEILDGEIAGARNRALFDLPPKPGDDSQAAPPESGTADGEDASGQAAPVPRLESSS